MPKSFALFSRANFSARNSLNEYCDIIGVAPLENESDIVVRDGECYFRLHDLEHSIRDIAIGEVMEGESPLEFKLAAPKLLIQTIVYNSFPLVFSWLKRLSTTDDADAHWLDDDHGLIIPLPEWTTKVEEGSLSDSLY